MSMLYHCRDVRQIFVIDLGYCNKVMYFLVLKGYVSSAQSLLLQHGLISTERLPAVLWFYN